MDYHRVRAGDMDADKDQEELSRDYRDVVLKENTEDQMDGQSDKGRGAAKSELDRTDSESEGYEKKRNGDN